MGVRSFVLRCGTACTAQWPNAKTLHLDANRCRSLHLVAACAKNSNVAERLGFIEFCAGLAGFLVRWCNGSTEAFGAFSPGSNPGRTAKRPARLPQSFAGTFSCSGCPIPV